MIIHVSEYQPHAIVGFSNFIISTLLAQPHVHCKPRWCRHKSPGTPFEPSPRPPTQPARNKLVTGWRRQRNPVHSTSTRFPTTPLLLSSGGRTKWQSIVFTGAAAAAELTYVITQWRHAATGNGILERYFISIGLNANTWKYIEYTTLFTMSITSLSTNKKILLFT